MDTENFFNTLTTAIAEETQNYVVPPIDPEASIGMIALRRYVYTSPEGEETTRKEIQFAYSSHSKYAHESQEIDLATDYFTTTIFPETIDDNIAVVYIHPVSEFSHTVEAFPIFDGDTKIAEAYNFPNTRKYILALKTAKPGSLYLNETAQPQHRTIMYKAMDKLADLIQRNIPLVASEALNIASDEEMRAMGMSHFFTPLNNRSDGLRASIEQEMAQMNQRNEQALQLANSISQKSAQLAALEANPSTIDLRTITHPLVESVISKLNRSNGRWHIEVKTKPLQCTPDTNPDNFDLGESGSITIDPMYINVHPSGSSGRNVLFAPVDRTTLHRGYSNSSTVHPHVFGGPLHACFGSFGDAVSTAIAEGKYDVLIDVLMIFLQQANNGDPAGRTWINWLTREQRQPRSRPTSPDTPEVAVGTVVEIRCRTCEHADDDANCQLDDANPCQNYDQWENGHRNIPVTQPDPEPECATCLYQNADDENGDDPCEGCDDYYNYEAA